MSDHYTPDFKARPRPSGDAHWTKRTPDHIRSGTAAPGAKLDMTDIAEICTAFDGGASQTWLAKKYGVSRLTIWRHLKARNIPRAASVGDKQPDLPIAPPQMPKGLTKPPLSEGEDRFWRHVDMSGDCWEWRAARDTDGYGRFRIGGRGTSNRKAHRIAYERTYGEIPPGLLIRHTCDNPGCVRPEHLILGTHKDNAEDRRLRGRMPPSGAKLLADTRRMGRAIVRYSHMYDDETLNAIHAEYASMTKHINVELNRRGE